MTVPTTTSRAGHRTIFAALCLAIVPYTLLLSLVTPALPALARDLEVSQSSVTWLFTGFLVVSAVATPIAGRLADVFGKRRLVLFSLVALFVGGVVSGLGSSFEVVLTGRLVQGLGGGLMPLAFAVVRDEFPSERVSSGIGGLAALLSAGVGFGLVFTGPIVDVLSLDWLFWLPSIIAAVAFVGAVRVIPESPVRSPGRIAWGSAAALSAWLVALLLGVSQAPHSGWTSGRVLGLLALAVAFLLLWVWSELRVPDPLVDLRLMRRPAVWRANAIAFLFGAAAAPNFVLMPTFVQSPSTAGYGFGASLSEAGLILLPMTVATFVVGLTVGPIERSVGSRPPLMTGSAVLALACGLFVVAHDERWQVVVVGLLAGIGAGLTFSSIANAIVASSPVGAMGVALGMNANIRQIGSTVGTQVAVSILAAGAAAGGFPREGRYVTVYVVMLAVSLLAITLCLTLRVGRAGDEVSFDAEWEAVASGGAGGAGESDPERRRR